MDNRVFDKKHHFNLNILWRGGNAVDLEFGNILRVRKVTISDIDWNNSCTVNTVTGCSVIRNAEYGYLDINYLLSCGGCGSVVGYPPYNVTVVYESGLSTGTASQPAMLAALTIAAQINLNECDATLSNEGVADIGITKFTNQSYSEQRAVMGNSVFGNSAMAQRAARLVRKYQSKPSIGFH